MKEEQNFELWHLFLDVPLLQILITQKYLSKSTKKSINPIQCTCIESTNFLDTSLLKLNKIMLNSNYDLCHSNYHSTEPDNPYHIFLPISTSTCQQNLINHRPDKFKNSNLIEKLKKQKKSLIFHVKLKQYT